MFIIIVKLIWSAVLIIFCRVVSIEDEKNKWTITQIYYSNNET